MEGTKHEKAVLVILSYIVGLTSGFIGFGLVNDRPTLEGSDIAFTYVEPVVTNEPAAPLYDENVMPDVTNIVESVEPVEVVPVVPTDGVVVSYQDGRLTVNDRGSVQLLSVERSRLNLEAASYFTKQGMHSVEPIFSTSPDNGFIFFCEQDSSKDMCQAFVYDMTNKMIHYVTNNGAKVTLTRSDAQQVAWVGTALTIGTNASESPANPWLLAAK